LSKVRVIKAYVVCVASKIVSVKCLVVKLYTSSGISNFAKGSNGEE